MKEEYSMNHNFDAQIRVDLQLIDTIGRVLGRTLPDSGEPLASQLKAIRDRLEKSMSSSAPLEDPAELAELLPTFMRANPTVSSTVSEELVREAIAFVSGVLSFHKRVNDVRPLTEEEKKMGLVLLDVLKGAKSLL
jgi:hypothetical protein